jgi:sugar (glycoside-pentoside-hexuronide) transporter
MFGKKKKDPSMVTGREKAAFALANIGNIPLMTLLSSYLMLFYTTVLDMDPGKIATMFLISKVMDGISDPVTGFLIDRFPSGKMGKFRPVLILGAIICSINYVLLWFGPAWVPGAKYTVAYITYLLLGWTFDIMDIPLNSVLPVMTDNLKQRNTLSLIKSLCYGAGMLVVSMIVPQVVANATLDSYYVLIFGAVAVVILCTVLGALGIKERVKFSNDAEKKYSFRELLKFLAMGPVLCFFIVDLLVNIAGNMISTAATYFYTYIMGDLTLATSVTALTAIGGNVMYIFVLLKFPDKFGKRIVAGVGLLIGGIAYFARLINPTSYLFLVIALNIAACGNGFETLLKYSIQADNTNYVEYKTGKHAESAIASLSSFSTKVAQGIGGAIPGYVLAAMGWKGVQDAMSAPVLNGILACNTWIPGALYVGAGVILLLCYKLDGKQLEEINEKLKMKHVREMEEL